MGQSAGVSISNSRGCRLPITFFLARVGWESKLEIKQISCNLVQFFRCCLDVSLNIQCLM